MKRPKHLDPPAHLNPSPVVPEPQWVDPPDAPAGEEERPEPTHYGDWEKSGIAIDF